MKTFRMIGVALVATMFGFAMSSCNDDDEDYKFTYVPEKMSSELSI